MMNEYGYIKIQRKTETDEIEIVLPVKYGESIVNRESILIQTIQLMDKALDEIAELNVKRNKQNNSASATFCRTLNTTSKHKNQLR